jgi:hypothetical protein
MAPKKRTIRTLDRALALRCKLAVGGKKIVVNFETPQRGWNRVEGVVRSVRTITVRRSKPLWEIKIDESD